MTFVSLLQPVRALAGPLLLPLGAGIGGGGSYVSVSESVSVTFFESRTISPLSVELNVDRQVNMYIVIECCLVRLV